MILQFAHLTAQKTLCIGRLDGVRVQANFAKEREEGFEGSSRSIRFEQLYCNMSCSVRCKLGEFLEIVC